MIKKMVQHNRHKILIQSKAVYIYNMWAKNAGKGLIYIEYKNIESIFL